MKVNNFTHSFEAATVYDSLWALALSLNKTSEMVQSMTREQIKNVTLCKGFADFTISVSLENFTYWDADHLVGCIMKWNLKKTNFNGVSVSKGTQHVHSGGGGGYCRIT